MRLPRFRLRSLLITVALIAVVLPPALFELRRRVYLARADYYREKWMRAKGSAKATYYQDQWSKYVGAATNPWKSVPPDPPEPK